MRYRLALLSCGFLFVATSLATAAPPDADKIFTAGTLREGEKEYTDYLKQNPKDDQARFALGTLQFVRSVEHLAQSIHHFGALSEKSRLARQLPVFRLPVPENPNPQKITYPDVRRILQNFTDDLAKSEATLAQIKDKKVKLPLAFGMIHLDVDGNGKVEEQETLWKIYVGINNGLGPTNQPTEAEVKSFVIAFDYADVLWLRGYCHLLSAMSEMILIGDQQQLFDAIAHQLFANPDVPTLPLADFAKEDASHFASEIADAIAAIHLMHFPVKEPKRGEAVVKHLEAVIELSRKNWDEIVAETDNDREWIPNPKQDGVIPGVKITDDMIKGWREFLDEADAIVAGKKLIPHWRMKEGMGVNLRQVFLKPRDFDLVLWVQGSAAIPYLEKGETTKPETWNRLQTTFRGQFIGFSIWFN